MNCQEIIGRDLASDTFRPRNVDIAFKIALPGAPAMTRRFRNELILLSGFTVLLALKLRNKHPRTKANNFKGQSVVITGGSRGLGLAIAQVLAAEGARLTLLARDAQELEHARHKIINEFPNAEVLIITCDVIDTERIHLALKLAAETYGGIDMLVNNAGTISMDLHFYTIMQMVNSALPYLRKSQGRRIVNICSMDAPHMLTDNVSKCALSGYSRGLMTELAREKISVTIVYPALTHENDFVRSAAGDAAPSIARKIVKAAYDRRVELAPSMLGKARGLAATLFPKSQRPRVLDLSPPTD
jgi:NAD(P)-dependent dehydrogenase (short-subunit alcohol dehydrogenase family)